jgi:hypothetical protein
MIGGNMKYLLTILVLLGCLSADARADFNGIDLSTMCVSNNPAIRDQCTAWISGFQAGISANDEKSNMHVCLPNELLGSQAVLIIEKFMKEHPELDFGQF